MPRERLIVALDVSSVADAEAMVERLGDAVSFYKIGYQLAFAGGLGFARDAGRAAASRCSSTSSCTTSATPWPRASRAWRSSARPFSPCTPIRRPCTPRSTRGGGIGLRILAVTVLTSYDDADLAAAGYDFTVPELVAERAAQARDIGVDGLVCSAEEAAESARHRRRRHGAGDAGHPAGRRRQAATRSAS